MASILFGEQSTLKAQLPPPTLLLCAVLLLYLQANHLSDWVLCSVFPVWPINRRQLLCVLEKANVHKVLIVGWEPSLSLRDKSMEETSL